ncbi:MAG: biopolymer transporter ExbD [Pseudomonadota bacterium]|uniref:Biopolymer transporter ExbD n=1 Tax=Caldimonas aquatica TaxID=376175 RepID=A0ABY6MTA5_9BURK|nr:biopolymer transporter ExbD [Schlegelella aquatica]UZD55242.1 biopolymer transporter ExbD [Schlegelella aquatica]
MAFGRLERAPDARPMSEINMTPLIDVMLVLLVIFMIAAPLMTTGLPLELPRTDAGRPVEAPHSVSLTVAEDGTVQLDDEPVAADRLQERLAALAARAPQTEVHLRADRRVPYGTVAELIGRVQDAGLHRIAFVTERP